MAQKTFNVYACKMTIDNFSSNTTLTNEQITSFLNVIKSLPVDLTLEEHSRYRKDK